MLPQEITIQAPQQRLPEKCTYGKPIDPLHYMISELVLTAHKRGALHNFRKIRDTGTAVTFCPVDREGDFDLFMFASGIFPKYDIGQPAVRREGTQVVHTHDVKERKQRSLGVLASVIAKYAVTEATDFTQQGRTSVQTLRHLRAQ